MLTIKPCDNKMLYYEISIVCDSLLEISCLWHWLDPCDDIKIGGYNFPHLYLLSNVLTMYSTSIIYRRLTAIYCSLFFTVGSNKFQLILHLGC